jgi:hypothetical protein
MTNVFIASTSTTLLPPRPSNSMKRKPHYPQCHESEQISHSGLIHPQRLRFGDTVGVVSPASWMSEEELAAGKRTLEKLGFSVHLHPQNYLRFHQFAGRDEERIRAFEAMLLDSSIKAIMFAKGGYGALRIIDQLDFRMIRANPKIIIGFSDATALLASILSRSKFLSLFHERRDQKTVRIPPATVVKKNVNTVFKIVLPGSEVKNDAAVDITGEPRASSAAAEAA